MGCRSGQVHPDKHSGDERAAQAFVAVSPLSTLILDLVGLVTGARVCFQVKREQLKTC